MKPRLSIIIPAYNEEKRIAETLKDYIPYAKKRSAEIIAVCDGTDATPKIVKRFRSVRLINVAKKLGKGGGIFRGFKAAAGNILGFVDADNSITPDEFQKLVSEILSGYDCAVASRRIAGSKIIEHGNYTKKLGSIAINLIARRLFGIPVHDTQCGAKAFKKEAIDKILPKMRSTGFEFDVELLWRIKRAGYSIKEVPITWRAKENSKFSMLEAPKMLFNLIFRRIGF